MFLPVYPSLPLLPCVESSYVYVSVIVGGAYYLGYCAVSWYWVG
jgi:hypothetical protein